VVMHAGILQQVGSPEEVYANPVNLFVAQFVGSPVMNVADVTVKGQDGTARVVVAGSDEGFVFPSALIDRLQAAGSREGLVLGIRPEALDISLTPATGYIPAEAHIIEPLGSHDIVDLSLGSEMIRARTRSAFVPHPGTPVWVRADPHRAHFFDKTSGQSVGVRL